MPQLNGQIDTIFETEYISDKFKKRQFVVITNDQKPQTIILECHNDKTELLDRYSEGDTVSVDYNVNGKKWMKPGQPTKYFVTLVAWKLERV